MIHPGYFITPNFIFKDDLLKTNILRHEIESNLANSIQNNIINFTKKFHPYMENAIAIQHLYAANYYHILLEILPSLFFIKKEIIESSYFLYRKNSNVGFNAHLFHKIFKFFGFKTLISNMVNIKEQMIMVKNLLILTPKHLIELDRETLLYMKEFIFKKYFDSISKSKPNNLTIVKSDKIDLKYILCDYVPFRFSLFEHQKRKIIDPITNNNIPHENLFDIDAKKAELDCDAKPMHEQRQNPPPVQPANGNPIPNDEQQNAVRPASFNSDLQKLIMMGYSPEKAKNALLAADFNLLLAIKKLQGL